MLMIGPTERESIIDSWYLVGALELHVVPLVVPFHLFFRVTRQFARLIFLPRTKFSYDAAPLNYRPPAPQTFAPLALHLVDCV
jgi:hypothetical protein